MAKNTLLDIAYVGNHGVKLQGFLNANQKNPAAGFARPYGNWPSDITAALNEFYSNFNSLQVKYEQQLVGGLTLLNSFTWEHSLDNASASLEGNTPSPQDANNLRADYAQSDYNLPIANITSLVYELPFGHGQRFLGSSNGVVNTLVGGWQVSGINTMQAGTPFNITYGPNSAQAVSPQISATYRGANEYRPNKVPGQSVTQGRTNRAANTGYVNYINFNAFVLPPIKDAAGNVLSPFGNASRNPGRTPAFYQTDLALNKNFSTPIESLKVQFRTEFYNIFNHTNLYLPGTISGTQGTHNGNRRHRWNDPPRRYRGRCSQRRRPDHQHLRAAHHSVRTEGDLLTFNQFVRIDFGRRASRVDLFGRSDGYKTSFILNLIYPSLY